MLVLTRKETESVVLIHNGEFIGEMQVVRVGSGPSGQNKIKIGLEMSKDVVIWRKEIWEKMQGQEAEAKAISAEPVAESIEDCE